MAYSFASVQLERFRREAKKLAKAASMTHTQALDRIAFGNGYPN